MSKQVDEELNISRSSMGGLGGYYITNTVAHTPPSGKFIVAIQGETDCVISASSSNITGLNGFTISTEGVRYGRFTSVTLASGKAIAYYGV